MAVKCPKCQTDNPEDSKFCKECATPFPGAVGVVPTKTLETPLRGLAMGSTVAGKYKILAVLGQGGMGVVYKAEDTKLKRIVALKFLSLDLTSNPEARERFIFEAQAASALDHPNICTVYEINESDGQIFIAMAFVEGESLRDKIVQGPLKLEEAITIAAQITDGLHEAHEKGIVHRDIKSSNIMITAKGQAMIMDFGIAKLTGEKGFTRTGTTMGTVAYMSPEQARGEKVNLRTDIWSLGVVLYEMVIGKLPFKGDHEQAVIYSILNEDPEPMTGLRTGVPMELERLVSKALVKDPAARYQHADDILVDLKFLKENITDFLKSPAVQRPAVSKPQPKRWKHLLPWGIAILMTLVAFIFQSKLTRLSFSSGGDVKRYTLEVPSLQVFTLITGPGLAISPDGTQLVYVGYGETDTQLYVRKMDQLETTPIPGTEGTNTPFFSPDGRWIGFFLDKRLKKVELGRGQPITICEVSETAYGASWGQNEIILFGQGDTGLAQVSSSGGTPQIIAKPDIENGVIRLLWPEILPGGKAALCTIWRGSLDSASVGLVDLETGVVDLLLEEATFPKYSPSGHIVYASTEKSLMAIPFSLKRLKVTGPVVSLIDGINVKAGGPALFTFSNDGSLVFFRGFGTRLMIVMVDRQGNEQSLIEEIRGFRAPRFSPDGKRIVVDLWGEGAQNIYVYELNPVSSNRLTFEGGNYYPIWTLDSKRIMFSSRRAGKIDLYWKNADGSGAAESLYSAEHDQAEISLSPDGKRLVYVENHPSTGRDLWVLPLEGERKPRPYLKTPAKEFSPMLSPDGRFLAYTSDELGKNEVYVKTFPDDSGGKWRVSTNGGAEPLWSRDGRELFYRGENKIISVAVETEPVFKLGTRKMLFEDVYRKWIPHTNYDIHPDNEHFVFVKIPEETSMGMIVVLNWFEELKRLVPTGKQ